MKKLLIAVAALALLVWIATWFRTPEAVATSGARTWPANLGPLEAAEKRFPPRAANDAAKRLTAIGQALPKSEAVDEFVWREIARGEITIGQPPALPDVTAMRELLLREPIVWERYEGIGGDDDSTQMRALRMSMARMLVASALTKARASDAKAWDDLHAVWKFAATMEGEPQVMWRTASLSMARMINGVAWKMPLPAPAWVAEVQQHDYVRPLLEAVHHQSASYWRDGATLFPTKMLADSVEKDRRIAQQVFQTTACDVTLPMNDLGTDLRMVWRRAFRFRAEREATANAVRAREGKAIETRSRCSDGAWTFDGTTLRFSRDIPMEAQDRPMPLSLRIKG